MATVGSPQELKHQVRSFWDAEPCGARDLQGPASFENQAAARYNMEPHIPVFAGFAESRGLKVLEIGVGMGADYLEWLKAGAVPTGIDLTSAGVQMTSQRCRMAGYVPDVLQADAENLPFLPNGFDVVYSYGVMHHSPDTQGCLREAFRVLKPGGNLRLMLYHHPSLTGLMLWLRYGLLRGKSMRESVYYHLESPGTKCFTKAEMRKLLGDFSEVKLDVAFSPGDLLLNQPSQRFRPHIYRWIWKLYPRRTMRLLFHGWGLCLLVQATKPSGAKWPAHLGSGTE
jgi:ubiquinone/menaquinone biosynthesis C-methylase UbiE